MQRVVEDPAGETWDVHVKWVGRRVGRATLLGRWQSFWAARRARRGATGRGSKTDRADIADGVLEGAGCLGDIGLYAVIVAIVVLLAVFVAPPAVALLLGLGELLLVFVVAAAVLIFRTVTRGAWSVVARSRRSDYRWRIVGYRRARRLVIGASESIAAGNGVLGIDHSLTDGQAPLSD